RVGVVLGPALVHLHRAVPVGALAQPGQDPLGRLALPAQATVDEHVRTQPPGGHVLTGQTRLQVSGLRQSVVVARPERGLTVPDQVHGTHQRSPPAAGSGAVDVLPLAASPAPSASASCTPAAPATRPPISGNPPSTPPTFSRRSWTPPATSGSTTRGTPRISGTTSRGPRLLGASRPSPVRMIRRQRCSSRPTAGRNARNAGLVV